MPRTIGVGLVIAVTACLFGGCGGGGGGGGSNQGVISFIASGFRLNEDGTQGTEVTLERVGGSAAVSVTVNFTGGTATGGAACGNPGVDYEDFGGSIVVSWAAGDTANKIVSINYCPDNNDEQPGETVDLALANPTGGAVLGLAIALLTINDDDEAGAIQFKLNPSGPYGFAENGTALGAGPVTIERVGGVDGAISATIVSTDGTANSDPLSIVEPIDYTPIAITITFPDQSASDIVIDISPHIIDDLLPERQYEQFELSLTNLTNGAALGSPSAVTINLQNDDLMLAIPNPVAEPNGFFGSAVAKVGARLAVGAPGSHAPAGRVRTFDMYTDMVTAPTQIGPDLSQTFALQFGQALAPDGIDLLVGSAGGAWMFDDAAGTPTASFTSGLDGFGSSLISLDDGRVVVGAPLASPAGFQAGLFHVYGNLLGELQQSIAGRGAERFGSDFALGPLGLVVGAPGGTGSVHLYSGNPLAFNLVIDNPFPVAGPSPSFGAAVGTRSNLVFVGAPDEDTFAPNDGRLYVFNGPTTTTVLPPGGIVANGRFGAQILTIGTLVCVQEPGGGPGAAGRVFVLTGGGGLVATFDPSPTAPASEFGASMCEYDGAIVIGAPKHPFLLQSGTVFIFAIQ